MSRSLPSVFVLLQQYIQQWSDHGFVFPKLIGVHWFLFWLIPSTVLNWPITWTRLTFFFSSFQKTEMCDDCCNTQYLMYWAHTGRKHLLFLAVACWQLCYLLSRWLFITLSLTDKTLHNTILWCCQINLFR